ncbi:unnamed protein product, partial [Brassica oleracea]
GIRSYVRSELLACDLQCGICGICCSCQIGRVCSNHYNVGSLVFFCNSSSLALIDSSRNHSETGVRVLIYRIEQETNKLTFIYHLNMKMCILLNLNRDRMKINGI